MEENERTAVRRRDRAKDDGWIRSFLRQAPVGFMAMEENGQPYLNSNLFVYDESRHAIYLHTARTGRTPATLAEGARVAFTAAVIGRLLPAAEALEFSVEYGAVVVFGRARVVNDEAEKLNGLERIMAKYAPHLEPGRDYRAITTKELARTAVHRIDIEAWTGKEKVAAPDFAGAYLPTWPGIPLEGSAF